MRGLTDNEVKTEIEDLLETKVRPFILSHNGDISFRGYEDGVVRVSFSGACSGCPSADLGTRGFVEEILRAEIPEVQSVELEQSVSSDLLAQARQILFGEKTV